MDWSWAIGGITDEIPRTTGDECINYMTNRYRWTEAFIVSVIFIYIMYTNWKRLAPIKLPPVQFIEQRHSPVRLLLLISMTLIFGIELGFKLAGRSMLFALNPCHVQTCVQIYLLAAKPSKTTTAFFRIQMNNLNGPFLAFVFPEVEGRTFPLEQATYWIQHALLYIIPIYLLKSGAYSIEDISDYKWVKIGTAFMLFYHFTLLNALSIITGINVDHMLCPALADPFQGQYYRIAACMHEAVLCPLLNKITVLLFRPKMDPTMFAQTSSTLISQRNINDDIYHKISLQEQQKQQQLAQEYLPPIDHSMSSHHEATQLRQRYNSEINGSNGTGHIDAESDIITAEYTMPTTKID